MDDEDSREPNRLGLGMRSSGAETVLYIGMIAMFMTGIIYIDNYSCGWLWLVLAGVLITAALVTEVWTYLVDQSDPTD